MSDFLGIDTSNYTTSAAIFRAESCEIIQRKMRLPVKSGETGLRQSDAVFHHTVQISKVLESLFSEIDGLDIKAVCASTKPRNVEGSYMPCFLSGEAAGRAIASAMRIPFYGTSHQIGHILAALYSANAMELREKPFIVFHVSGGTTECLLCEPNDEHILTTTVIGQTLDLKAGQVIDRVGVMLGMDFPCGAEMERVARNCNEKFAVKPVIKGTNCCFSGVENKCREMLNKYGEITDITKANIANYCLTHISDTILGIANIVNILFGSLPLIFAGGVMSNADIAAKIISQHPHALFAAPEFSCDNAAGIALAASR